MTRPDARLAIEVAVESPDLLDSVASHLTTCSECRGYWEELQALRQELSNWPAAVPDDAALRAIRAEVLQKLATRKLWGPRLGWAAALIVAAGTVVAGWNREPVRPMPQLTVRFAHPAAPELSAAMQPTEKPKLSPPAVKTVKRDEKLETPPAIHVAAIISPDPEAGTAGGVMLELESRNPNVVLYFLADNQGD